MDRKETEKHYKQITYGDNRVRLRLLKEFRELVIEYFDKSRHDRMNGPLAEDAARSARESINRIMNRVYKIIRLADINPRAASTPLLSAGGGHDKNIDLVRNIFNLERNNIPTYAAVDFIERAIDVYQSNRVDSFIRTVNPVFWMSLMLDRFAAGWKKRASVQMSGSPSDAEKPGRDSGQNPQGTQQRG